MGLKIGRKRAKRKGRPTLYNEPASKISLYLPESIVEWVRARAEREGKSASQIIARDLAELRFADRDDSDETVD